MISVREIEEKDQGKKNLDKIGGYPTHLPPEGTYEDDYFLMQIYNDKGIWPYKEGVLCWQFYQVEDYGGYIENVIEVPVGAKLNTGNEIQKREDLGEYVIEYKEEEEIEDETLSDEEYLDKYDNEDPYSDIFCRSKVGGYFGEERKWYEEEGYEYVAILAGDLCNWEINLGTDRKIIVKNKKTGKLEMGGN